MRRAVRAPAAAGDRRLHHLEGFKRVPLKAGEKKRVSFELADSAVAVYGEDGKPFVPEGETSFFVGGGQPGFADVAVAEVHLKQISY